MSIDLIQLLLVGLLYIGLLFGIACLAIKGLIPRSWFSHHLTYILSLGVYASAWSLFGSVGLAYQYGFGFLAYYLGLSGAFMLAPVLLVPILRITRTFQLSSIADLLAFRYRSPWVGSISAGVNLISGLLLLSLQITIVVNVITILVPGAPASLSGAVLCGVMLVFTLFLGITRNSEQEKSNGLIAAITLDSLIKLIAFLALGLYAIYEIFGGLEELNNWLDTYGMRVSAFERHLEDSPWRALLLIFFGSAIVMPHMFHMVFKENLSPKSLYKASWGLPLYLFLISLPVPPVLWAAIKSGAPTVPDYFTLGITLSTDSPLMILVVFTGALSAATGLILVTTQALASTLLNHMVLPVYRPGKMKNIYSWVNWVKGCLVFGILFAAFIFFVNTNLSISILGVLAFTAGIQLLPAVLGVLYWPVGNHKGVIVGLSAGTTTWFLSMFLPFYMGMDCFHLFGLEHVHQFNTNDWHTYTLVALTVNVTFFVLVSLLTETPATELSAAQLCSVDTLSRPARRELEAGSSDDFKAALTKPLGDTVANREVSRALAELDLPKTELRPYALRRLRDQIEANLSGLLGPSIAQDIVKSHLAYKTSETPDGKDIHYVERKLEDYRSRLTGLAAELDSLRRYHRQTLQNLPVAACSLGNDMEILMWNHAMYELTGIAPNDIIGSRVFSLPCPWSEHLYHFAVGDALHLYKQRLMLEGKPHWLSLHKAMIDGPENSEQGQVLLIEDNTETRLLEDKLIHSERLASVGRLAAGVAHEIGNPVTGIACLAQNIIMESGDKETLNTARQIIDQTRRISTIVQSLMNFSRTGNHSHPASHECATLSRCVDEAIKLLSLSEKEKQIEYLDSLPPNLKVNGDEQRLVQVFINLLGNARDASPDRSTISITGKQEAGSVIVEITDPGCGIPPEQLDHIFEPFYTTKEPGRGTGLGLSLVYSIIEEHYGSIEVISPADKQTGIGTRVVVTLPAETRHSHDRQMT
ncbi:MAG: ATPase [Proteobacteria bacterium]|nr:MAG: ATPase [Pseudomonadota bacterium]